MTDVDPGNLTGAKETALIVPFPAADEIVGSHRRAFDHAAAAGVPAHVTVLGPFLPPRRITDAVIDDLRKLLTPVRSFECVFSRVAWFGREVLWLAPDPPAPFETVTDLVWQRFPECPPYGGAYPDVIPHLTVGSTRLGDFAALQRACVDVRAHLPIRTEADRVCLIAGGGDAPLWRTVAEFALASGGCSGRPEFT